MLSTDGIIHLAQILALVVLGLAIYSQETLTGLGISHYWAMVGAFWMLVVSLGYEHFGM